MDISVVVISYNSAKFLGENLNSFAGQTVPFKEVVVIDNNSSDDSTHIIDTFEKNNPGFPLKKIFLDYNSGYAAGANTGIRATSSELVLVANSDTILDEHFNETVIRKFEDDSRLSLLSPLILRFDKQTVDSAGQTYSRSLHPVETGFNRPVEEVDTNEKEVFSVCGAATVFRRDALETLKQDNQYYDEDFFIFWEDFDIGWRANLLGLKTLFYPDALVYHFRSATLERSAWARFSLALARPPFIKYHLVKNRFLTLIKNFRWRRFYWTVPFIILKDIIWVGMLTFVSPKIIIKLMKSTTYVKRALAKRKELIQREK